MRSSLPTPLLPPAQCSGKWTSEAMADDYAQCPHWCELWCCQVPLLFMTAFNAMCSSIILHAKFHLLWPSSSHTLTKLCYKHIMINDHEHRYSSVTADIRYEASLVVSQIMKVGLNRYCIACTKWRISSSSHRQPSLVITLTMAAVVSRLVCPYINFHLERYSKQWPIERNTLWHPFVGEPAASGEVLHHIIGIKELWLYQKEDKLQHLDGFSNYELR